MEYRRLGRSGLKVSEFSYGSWVTFARQIDVAPAKEMLAIAYDAGVNFFDNAEGYEEGRSEEVMGQALHALGWPRDTFVVSSKVFWGGDRPTQRGLSAKHVTEACHAALRRLRVDHLDLYFCHRPDIDTPIEETVRAMDNLIRQGKVLYWGTSEWSAEQIASAHAAAREWGLTPPTMEQPQYNLFERQKVEGDYLPLYERYGLGTTIWSPLASGILTGKYDKGIPEGSRFSLEATGYIRGLVESEKGRANIARARELGALAREAGLALHHMALLWCLRNPHVSTVILGASRPAQLRDNLAALDHRALMTDELSERIEAIVGNRPEPPQRY